MDFADQMPEYPGGENVLKQRITQNLRYPIDAMIGSIQGKVFVSFVVDTEGNMRNIHVSKAVDPLPDEEAL